MCEHGGAARKGQGREAEKSKEMEQLPWGRDLMHAAAGQGHGKGTW